MLSGVGKRLGEVWFLQLVILDHHKYLDVAFLEQLKGIEITYQDSVCREKTKMLDAITGSSVYSAITVIPLLLLAAELSREMSASHLLHLLSRLILFTIR